MADNKIIAGILNDIDSPLLINKLTTLSMTKLNSLQMELYNKLSNQLKPTDLLKNYNKNIYVQPSNINPIEYCSLELELYKHADEYKITPIILSPVAQFGSCSAVASVSQNKIITGLRNVEVLSDPTNMLALHIANGIKQGTIENSKEMINYCTTHRATRVQATFFPGQVPHFGLFCAVSAGQDTGSYAFECEALKKHISFYKSFFSLKKQENLIFTLQKRSGYKDVDGFFKQIHQTLINEFPMITINILADDLSNQYYQGINIKIYLAKDDELYEVGDLGFVDWTQKLLSLKKARMLISAIGLDRLLF